VRKPLWTVLKNGQTVDIIRADAQRPQPVWETMSVTGRAKAAIRRALKSERRAADIKMGEAILRQAFERAKREYTRRAVELAAEKFGRPDAEELLASLGAAELTGAQTVAALWPEAIDDWTEAPADAAAGPAIKGIHAGSQARVGECCLPVPGDRIVGIARKGEGVTVHAIDCPRLAAYEDEPDRWLDLKWDDDATARPRQTALSLIFAHERGALAKVCAVIAEQNADIVQLEFTERKPDFYRARVDVEVRDAKHLNRVVTQLAAEPMVTEARRILPAREPALIAGAAGAGIDRPPVPETQRDSA
jgi:GTP pyrophosphokinase